VVLVAQEQRQQLPDQALRMLAAGVAGALKALVLVMERQEAVTAVLLQHPETFKQVATQQQIPAAAVAAGQMILQLAALVATVRPALSSSAIQILTRWLQQQPALP